MRRRAFSMAHLKHLRDAGMPDGSDPGEWEVVTVAGSDIARPKSHRRWFRCDKCQRLVSGAVNPERPHSCGGTLRPTGKPSFDRT